MGNSSAGLEERRLQFTREVDARELFVGLMTHLTAGQVHYFIWRAVRIAGDMVQTGSAKSRSHPEHAALHFVRTHAEKALADGLQVAQYRRARSQTSASVALFGAALKVNEHAFGTLTSDFDMPG